MTEHYKGYAVTLEYDPGASNPLDWTTPEERHAWYALCHRRHNLPFEIGADTDDYQGWAELAAAVTAPGGELEGKQYRFVRWHEHSGIAVSLLDTDKFAGWDVGCAGVIFGDNLGDIRASFAEWRAYVEGDVYTIRIAAPDGNEVDSLLGLFGYDEALDCARQFIDADAKLVGAARIRRYGRPHAPRAQKLHA